MARLTVACVLRKSKDYDEEYVNRLAIGVAEHLSIQHRFVCLSDVPVPCERIPLKHSWPGWWSKMELFLLEPPVLYLDLDSIVVVDLTDIAKQARSVPLTVLRDFYREKGIGSGMMAWAIDALDLYRRFEETPAHFQTKYGARGDQAFIEDHVTRADKWQDVLPGQVVSYKSHVRNSDVSWETGNGHVPEGARVVCFHGKPKPKDIGWQV